ncbi:MAG: RNA methyltransferase [Alphaproteobacteria bacterium]|nr:MAG: RNA methyltransferase [Alphaproteobacteria bacterium]
MSAREKGHSGTVRGAKTPENLGWGAPVVILVNPQLGENIGMAARAMANFALTDLRLVAPRDGWPSESAIKASSGAVEVIEGAQVFETVEEAIADLQLVYATTARERDQLKPVLTPEEAGRRTRAAAAEGQRVGLMFGPERAGLKSDHVALADAVLMVPVNPGFASLNLAQAVLLIGYEWFKHGSEAPPERIEEGATRPATKEELLGFFEHLERELDASGFLRPPEKRKAMVRNLRNIWSRTQLYDQDVRTLRGIIKSLVVYGGGRNRPDEDD